MLKKLLEILAVSIIVSGTAFAFFRLAGAIPVSVTQTQKQSTFDVSGEGKVVVKPDQAIVHLGVQKSGTSVAGVTEQVDQIMTQLSRQLKELGVDEGDIKTTSYSVYPDYQVDPYGTKSYNINSSVMVTVREIEKVSPVLDLVGSLGLTQSSGINFTLSDKLRDQSTKDARETAINAAKKKADELASLSGMKLGRIVNISEGNNAMPQPMYARDMAVSAEKVISTPAQVEPGSSEVSVTITLSYETR